MLECLYVVFSCAPNKSQEPQCKFSEVIKRQQPSLMRERLFAFSAPLKIQTSAPLEIQTSAPLKIQASALLKIQISALLKIQTSAVLEIQTKPKTNAGSQK